MASSITFTNLASGLDTGSIISQLMSVETLPKTMLQQKVAVVQNQVTALQQLNTAFASLSTSAASFLTGSTWTQKTASSSNSAITVTASSAAVPSSLNVHVNAAAAAASATLNGTTAANTNFTIYGSDGNPLTYKDADGNSVGITFDSGSGSMADVAAAINAGSSKSNLTAVVIKADGGDVLQITSTKTGASSNFSIKSTDGSIDLTGGTTTNGTDASLTVNNQTITSASNTVTITDGVTITIAAGTTNANATVAVTDDGSSRASAMSNFISQINSLLTTITSTTTYGTISTDTAGTSTGAGVLPGDSTLRALSTQLLNTIFPGDGSSLENYGISVDRNGALTFDSKKFTAAYQADPEAAQAAVVGSSTGADSFVNRVKKVADLASDSYEGYITQYIKSDQADISNLNDNIDAWTDRLAAKQASLETLYANLQTTLAAMQSQSTWLASQIDSLDSGWSKN